MNVLILAAGYATRLYPLTLDKAKPLLAVGGKPIIEWVVDNLVDVPDLETIYVVTNDKFASDFQGWSERYQNRQPKFKFTIVNDGSKSDEDKLGAIADINFVVTRENLSRSDLLIIAGDNLFTESLTGFVACANETEATVAVYAVGDSEAMKKYGNIAVAASGTLALLQPSLLEFDQIEISPDILAPLASRFFEKMEKTRLFCRGVGMTRDHRLVPLFGRFRGMSHSVFLYPV